MDLSLPSPRVDGDQCIRVIVVDGQEMVAESLAAVLASEPDISVSGVAWDTSTAVALVDRTCPEVAVIDYRLCDGDGIEAAWMIRQRNPTVKTVLLTSTTNEWVLAQALAAGCTGVISKATTVEKLAWVVRSVAQGERVVEGEFEGRFELRSRGASRKSVLTSREQEVLGAICLGLTTATMAQTFGVSEYTVRNHVRNILGKLNAHTKLEAVVHAARAGLLRFDD